MVADQGRKPAGSLAALGERTEVGRRGRLDLDRIRLAAGRHGRRSNLGDEPGHEVRVGQLEDHPIGDPADHLQGERPVSGDPYGQPPVPGPGQDQLGSLVLDRAPLDEVANDPDRLLERGQGGWWLAQHPARRVAPADAQVHPPIADLVQRGQGRGRHRRLASGRVGHARTQAQPSRRGRHQGQQGIRLAPQDVRIEQPAVVEAGRLGPAGQVERALDRVIRLEGEPELHGSGLRRQEQDRSGRAQGRVRSA